MTYILASENGTSLRASGWKEIGRAGGGTWSRPSREREDKHDLQPKIRFQVTERARSEARRVLGPGEG